MAEQQPIADKVRERFERAYNLLLAQRDASNEDIRFCDVDGGMWEDFFPNQYANRPKLEMNLSNESVYRLISEWMDNRFRVKYTPDSRDSSQKDAEILNGLYRRDENNSNGFDSYDNAFGEMVKGGVGGWRLRNVFVNPEEEGSEQEIIFEPVFNAYNAIIWDPNAKKYDKSDAKWCVILHEFTKESFEEQYPGVPIESFGIPPFFDRSTFNWTTKTQVFVAEYFEIKQKPDMVFVMRDPFGTERKIWKSDFKNVVESLEGFEKIREFNKKRQVVERTVTTANQVLEETKRIAGKYIPVVPVYGFRSYVDGQEFFYGKIRKLKDSNRLYNMAISRFAEDASTSTKQVPIFYQDEVEGLEQYWADAHLGKYPYLVKKPHLDNNGNETPVQREYLQPPAVDPNNATIAEVASGFINRKTGNNPEDVLDNPASGISVREQAIRVETPDAILFENMAKSMRWSGCIYRSMAAEIYDHERFVMLLTEDGLTKPTDLMSWVIGRDGKAHYLNDVTKGEYKVIVETGPAFASKRRETANILMEVLRMTPQGSQELPMVYTAMLANLDGEGLDGLRKWARQQQVLMGIETPETEEEELMLLQAQQAQNQNGAMDQLVLATAQKEMAEARERESKAQLNISNVNLNQVKGAEIVNNMQLDRFNAAQNAVQSEFERRTRTLPRLLQGL